MGKDERGSSPPRTFQATMQCMPSHCDRVRRSPGQARPTQGSRSRGVVRGLSTRTRTPQQIWKANYMKDYMARMKVEDYPHYHKIITERIQRHRARYRERAKAIHAKLGGRCFVCERPDVKLELHHLSYPNGKPEQGDHGGTVRWEQRIREAEKNPENFRSLCYVCHLAASVSRGKLDRLDKLRELIQESAKGGSVGQ